MREPSCYFNPKLTWLLISVAIFLVLDTMVVKQPSGMIPWRVFSGEGKIGPPQSCTWDYEARFVFSIVFFVKCDERGVMRLASATRLQMKFGSRRMQSDNVDC